LRDKKCDVAKCTEEEKGREGKGRRRCRCELDETSDQKCKVVSRRKKWLLAEERMNGHPPLVLLVN
jgi:hypothetical protein